MKRKELLFPVLSIALILLIPVVIKDAYFLHLFILVALFGQLASYWNLLDGYLGLINFGYAAYVGIGAYTSALMSLHFSLPLSVCMLLAGVTAGIIGVLLIIPCLRMVTFSTAIVTLAFGEIARVVATSWTSLTKGEKGLWGIPPLFQGQSKVPFFYLAFGLLFLGTMGLRKIIRSRLGLAIMAVRDDEVAAGTSGVEADHIKLMVSGISCFMAGITGAFYAHYILTITPGLFGIGYTIQVMTMSLFGGKGTLAGPLAGAFLLILMGEGFRFMEDYRFLVYGLLIIGTVLVFPTGLVGVAGRIKKLFLRWRA
jgi:branched-chain amino acid transport system permease protein